MTYRHFAPLSAARSATLSDTMWAMVVLLTCACSGSACAEANDRAMLQLRALASTCTACHAGNLAPSPDSKLPALAGMPADYLIARMKAFQSGAGSPTVMHHLARGYSDAQIERLAAYFASQRP